MMTEVHETALRVGRLAGLHRDFRPGIGAQRAPAKQIENDLGGAELVLITAGERNALDESANQLRRAFAALSS